jgi:hypothetical protein
LVCLGYSARIINGKDAEGSESPAQTQQHLRMGTAVRRKLGDSSTIPNPIGET